MTELSTSIFLLNFITILWSLRSRVKCFSKDRKLLSLKGLSTFIFLMLWSNGAKKRAHSVGLSVARLFVVDFGF